MSASVLSGTVILKPLDGEPDHASPRAMSARSATGAATRSRACGQHPRTPPAALPESVLLAAPRGACSPASRSCIDGDRSLRAPLRSFALSVSDPAWQPSAVAALVAERTIEDLVVGMFLEHQTVSADHADEREAPGHRARRPRSRGHHTSTALTPANLAVLLTVSLRHLQRAFGSSGITIAHSITSARVRTAAMLLSSPDAPELTIAEVAYRSGFRSTFELRSAFRGEHGVLPSEFRSNPRLKTVPEDV